MERTDVTHQMPPDLRVRLRLLGLTAEAIEYLENAHTGDGYSQAFWTRVVEIWEGWGERAPTEYWNDAAARNRK